ncbi:MAG: hypothetical protein FWD26_07875 [Treponema sp.]|nr:hypothetical protein [Treponema sp.]
MKPIFIIAMILIGAGCVFGAGNIEKTADENNSSVVTGGWHKMDIIDLNETILSFIDDYLDAEWSAERVWTQLVQGRRYMLAYKTHSTLGLLMLRRDFSGSITLEKDYKDSELLDYIGFLLTGEMEEDHEI